MKEGYAWLWIDTCCIDKRSSAELSEAINSMYRWYRNSRVCYTYLHDVDQPVFPREQNNNKFGKSNGWTLQELIAPKDVQFFNKDWVSVGNKHGLAGMLEQITRIPRDVLRDGLSSRRPSVAQIMSWAADRITTRVEDQAYSLLGLFGVNMPMLYGEGKKAFRRLQLEILRESNDQSIFTWDPYATIGQDGSVLADNPSRFRDCHDIEQVASEKFIDRLLMKYVESPELGTIGRESHWQDAAGSQQLGIFVVTNAGIQLCLPLVPSRDSSLVFRAILACTNSHGSLITIDLASRGSSFDRTFGTPDIEKTFPEFKTVYLTHHEDNNEISRRLMLNDTNALYHGFTRRGAFPRGITNDSVTLSSLGSDLVVIVYANDDDGSHFAVGLGNYLRQGWVHISSGKWPGIPKEDRPSWPDYARDAYKVMWNARAEHSRCMPKRRETYNYMHLCRNFTKHAHFPQSIWAADVIWGAWDRGNLEVRVDVVRCPGCCVGPREWMATTNNRGGPDMPGLMKMDHYSHELEMGGMRVKLYEFIGKGITLGDYGDFSVGDFKRSGNIFQDAHALGVDTSYSTYQPVASRVSGIWNEGNIAVTYCNEENFRLALGQPNGLSLPSNQQLVELLKALSTRLADKQLVITVIQCSGFYRADRMGGRMSSGIDSASGSGTEPVPLVPLCTIASPQVWRREPACAHRRGQFEYIRKHFLALVNRHQPAGTFHTWYKSANRRLMDEAIKYFSDMFGLEYLKNYVGEITFFKRLPSMAATGWSIK
ncbi:hypothetical protein EDD16DRAFT_1547849 [Pisolithus croceorrhizus]|nr:hypothetical protein EDD16DRAFT_1547849 [Pisolithus croceorrhizus]